MHKIKQGWAWTYLFNFFSKTNANEKGEALDMWVDKDVLIDPEITGGHSQYVLRHFQVNGPLSTLGLNN